MLSDTGERCISALRSLEPKIRALGATIETERPLPEDIVDELKRAGLFHILLPRDFGGLELDPVSSARIVEEASRIDGATGWCLMIAAQCASFTGMLLAAEAKAIWSNGGVVAGTARPNRPQRKCPPGSPRGTAGENHRVVAYPRNRRPCGHDEIHDVPFFQRLHIRRRDHRRSEHHQTCEHKQLCSFQGFDSFQSGGDCSSDSVNPIRRGYCTSPRYFIYTMPPPLGSSVQKFRSWILPRRVPFGTGDVCEVLMISEILVAASHSYRARSSQWSLRQR